MTVLITFSRALFFYKNKAQERWTTKFRQTQYNQNQCRRIVRQMNTQNNGRKKKKRSPNWKSYFFQLDCWAVLLYIIMDTQTQKGGNPLQGYFAWLYFLSNLKKEYFHEHNSIMRCTAGYKLLSYKRLHICNKMNDWINIKDSFLSFPSPFFFFFFCPNWKKEKKKKEIHLSKTEPILFFNLKTNKATFAWKKFDLVQETQREGFCSGHHITMLFIKWKGLQVKLENS